MPSEPGAGFCSSTRCIKILSAIAVIIAIIIVVAIVVPFLLLSCKKGYTGENCDICDSGYHMNKDGVCQGWKIDYS